LVPDEGEVEWTDPTGTLSLVERELLERFAGKPLLDLNVSGEVTLVSVTRAGVARLDIGDLVGQDGDVLHFVVSATGKAGFDERFDVPTPPLPDGNPLGVIAGTPVPDADLGDGPS
jgi:hypothetical protein